MPSIVEGLNLGDLLKQEGEKLYSRDVVTVALGQNLPLGTVLGRVTATGRVKRLDPAANDGTHIAIGILIVPVDAGLKERRDGVMIARFATVSDHALSWPVGITQPEQDHALDQLKALGILVRKGV